MEYRQEDLLVFLLKKPSNLRISSRFFEVLRFLKFFEVLLQIERLQGFWLWTGWKPLKLRSRPFNFRFKLASQKVGWAESRFGAHRKQRSASKGEGEALLRRAAQPVRRVHKRAYTHAWAFAHVHMHAHVSAHAYAHTHSHAHLADARHTGM